jgi:uncharacterized membrane protein
MKTYVITSGSIFGLLTLAHVWRVFLERHLATDPFFVVATIVSALLAFWAWRVLRVSSPS